MKQFSKGSKPRISFLDKSFCGKFSDDDLSSMSNFAKVSSQNMTSLIIKERLANGYRILDLGFDHVQDASKLVKKHFIRMDPLCNSIGLSTDTNSLQLLDYILLKKIEEKCSYCAIEEGTGKLVGVLIGSLETKNDQRAIETRISREQGKSLFYLLTLSSSLISKSQIYEKLDIENYFRIYVLCVKINHREKGIGLSLVRNLVDKSKELINSACVGVFISGAALTIGEKLNFEYLGETILENAKIPEEDYFKDLDAKECKLFCMALSNKKLYEPTISVRTSTISSSTSRTSKTKKKKNSRN